MVKRTPRRARRARVKKNNGQTPQKQQRRLTPTTWRTRGRGQRQRRDLQRHLLRGAAYSTGAGIVSMFFWWLKIRFQIL
jgi:hypothetical protein